MTRQNGRGDARSHDAGERRSSAGRQPHGELPASHGTERPASGQQAVADRLADELAGPGSPARQRAAAILRQIGAVDRAVYDAVARVPTPALDEAMRRLSDAANYSTTWLAIASGMALTGPSGRRAAARGLLAIAVTSAVVNVGVKSLVGRDRPDRTGAGVPAQRHVRMPSSTSFPSGHSASAFAFAVAISRDDPWLAIAIQFLAGAVAYSRVHTGVHYPGDAVVGALLGTGAGQVTSSVFDRLVHDRGWKSADGAVNPP